MAKKLWGGRFDKETDPLVEKFTRSIQFDHKLAWYDVFGSLFHVDILTQSRYLTQAESTSLADELLKIGKEIQEGVFKEDPNCEDIHTNIQNILENKLGEVALKLHMARSRNDQVVFATKMYCKNTMKNLQTNIEELVLSIDKLLVENDGIIMPGFTHMQHAQPVYLKDYLGTYKKMLLRDAARLEYISINMKITMGAGALAGTPISSEEYSKNVNKIIEELQKNPDWEETSKFMKDFKVESTTNSLDAVSDRDFVIEIISALAIVAMHLSRLSEDLIIWSTQEFDFVEIDEAFCTGSSLMPQKKNPDVLELVRGYAGRLNGNLVSVLTMMKGLPLTYNRDMQLDKEPLFNSFEIVSMELRVLAGLIKTLKFNEPKIEEYLKDESLYATDLVYYLVDRKVPFKQAHTIIGELIKYSITSGKKIKEMSGEKIKEFSDSLNKEEIIKLFDPKKSVESKLSIKR
ncbi:MAG: argininosuccinate lyase [Candidatus Omnitrophica bacterium]|nr:argininosuccinate lyase [Candidatus Omnitrophota bacterium]